MSKHVWIIDQQPQTARQGLALPPNLGNKKHTTIETESFVNAPFSHGGAGWHGALGDRQDAHLAPQGQLRWDEPKVTKVDLEGVNLPLVRKQLGVWPDARQGLCKWAANSISLARSPTPAPPAATC